MGICCFKSSPASNLDLLADDWKETIDELVDTLKKYTYFSSKSREIVEQNDLEITSIVKIFGKLDYFARKAKCYTVKLLPEESPNRNTIKKQIDEIPKLQTENESLLREKNCLIEENSIISKKYRKCDDQIRAFRVDNDAICKANENLLAENNKLRDHLESVTLQYDSLKSKVETLNTNIQRLEKEKEEFKKDSKRNLKRELELQQQIIYLQRIVNNRKKEYEEVEDNTGSFSTGQTLKSAEVSSYDNQLEFKNHFPAEDKPDYIFEESKPESDQITDSYAIESLEKIDSIRKDTIKLKEKVDNFIGTKNDKAFLHLRELLVRNIVKLDNVETEGHLIIRETRRDVIRLAKDILNDLTLKAQ